jgi:transposase InsO family protein
MRAAGLIVGPGTRARWGDRAMRASGFDEHGLLVLVDDHGRQFRGDLSVLLDDPSFELDRGDGEQGADPARAPAPDVDGLYESLPQEVKDQADERLAHLLEAFTGFRRGFPELAEPDEPRPEYDPERVPSQVERLKSKAAELRGQGQRVKDFRTLYEWRDAFRRRGRIGLVDGRKLPRPKAVDRMTPELHECILSVLARYRGKSMTGVAQLVGEVQTELRRRYPDRQTELRQSDDTVRRRIRDLARRPGPLGPRRRPQETVEPRSPYRSLVTDRPGEVVLIDSTKLNLLLVCPRTKRRVRGWLTVAQDHFTRAILAWRITVGAPKAEDACLLLLDVIRPCPWLAHWPDRARWRYHGVPERIVTGLREQWDVDQLAAKPVVAPDTVVVDGAWVTKSTAFWAACRRLDITLQIARPRTPTDKAQVERFFGTIDRPLQGLPGYTGRDVTRRGPGVEAEAWYFPHLVEDLLGRWIVGVYHAREHDGLRLSGDADLPVCPNDAYELGIAKAGFVRVPADRDLFYELLPAQVATIREGAGATVDGKPYNGGELQALADERSPYPHLEPRQWPFHYDRRDPSRVWLKTPRGDWLEVPCVDPPHATRPGWDVEDDYILARYDDPETAPLTSRQAEQVTVELLDQEGAFRDGVDARRAASADAARRAARRDAAAAATPATGTAAAPPPSEWEPGDFQPVVYEDAT